jgi:hypothetical protein
LFENNWRKNSPLSVRVAGTHIYNLSREGTVHQLGWFSIFWPVPTWNPSAATAIWVDMKYIALSAAGGSFGVTRMTSEIPSP